MMRTKWQVAIYQGDKTDDTPILESRFIHFADVHETMKKHKGKTFVVRIPKTAKPMEIQAFHTLKKLGYLVETR